MARSLPVTLCALLAVAPAIACDDPELPAERREASYRPGAREGSFADRSWPEGACLSADDPGLRVFEPDCPRDFVVLEGPRVTTAPDGTPQCAYTIAWTNQDSCLFVAP